MLLERDLEAYRERVNRRLEELLPPISAEPAVLHEAMHYSCLAPGKRLRPALCMASCRAVGAPELDALDAGCALEMVHAFSLIHDDLPAIDDDDLRRGQPTCHRKFGEAVALLAGDALCVQAFRVLAEAGYPAERLAAMLAVLTRALGSEGLVGGEMLDIRAESQPPSLERVEEIHRRKTGALMAASCEIGAIAGGATDEDREALRDYGLALGVAFQIVDDVLNETASPEVLGKAAGSDRQRGKMTYPAAIGLEASRAEARRWTERALAKLDRLPGDTVPLREIARFGLERAH